MIGPSVPCDVGSTQIGPSLPSEEPKVHSRGLVLNQASKRIGPAPRPLGASEPAYTEVYEKPKAATGAAAPDHEAPDPVAVSSSRRGELPPKGWSGKWSAVTKRAALLGALEESQMHVVYALRPHSELWQESVRAEHLEQAELDRLLREKVATKPRPSQKQRVKEAIQWLLEAGASLEALCQDGSAEVRRSAAELLAEAGAARCAALLTSEEAAARATAAEALGRLGKDAVAHGAELAELMGDSDTTVRMTATATIGKLGACMAKHCVSKLDSEKPREREAACEALGLMGAAASEYAAAVAELLEDSDWQVPTAAASALKRMRPNAAAKACAEVLGRCRTMARSAVSEALVRIGGADAAESVVPLLSSRDEGVRQYAAETMGLIGSEAKAFAQFLTPLKEDRDREVKRAAVQALARLGFAAPRAELGNGDEMPPPPERGEQGEKGKGKGKGKRK